MSLILAIESSCDEMAMAILKDEREFLSSVVASQIDVHAMYGGVVPEIARTGVSWVFAYRFTGR